jgi:hypothetical protein
MPSIGSAVWAATSRAARDRFADAARAPEAVHPLRIKPSVSPKISLDRGKSSLVDDDSSISNRTPRIAITTPFPSASRRRWTPHTKYRPKPKKHGAGNTNPR